MRPVPISAYCFDPKAQIHKRKICNVRFSAGDQSESVHLAHSNYEITFTEFEILVKYFQRKYEPINITSFPKLIKWKTKVRQLIRNQLTNQHIVLMKSKSLLNKMSVKYHNEAENITNFYKKHYNTERKQNKQRGSEYSEFDFSWPDDDDDSRKSSDDTTTPIQSSTKDVNAPSCKIIKEIVFLDVDRSLCRVTGQNMTTTLEDISHLWLEKVKFNKEDGIMLSIVPGDGSPEMPLETTDQIKVPNNGRLKLYVNRRMCTFPRHVESLDENLDDEYIIQSGMDDTCAIPTSYATPAFVETSKNIPKVKCPEALFLKMLRMQRKRYDFNHGKKHIGGQEVPNLNTNFVTKFQTNSAMFQRNGLMERALKNWIKDNNLQMAIGKIHFRIPLFLGNMELCYQEQNPEQPAFVVCSNSEKHFEIGSGIMNFLRSGQLVRKFDKRCGSADKVKLDHDKAHASGYCSCKRCLENLFILSGDSSCAVTTVEKGVSSSSAGLSDYEFAINTNRFYDTSYCRPF